MARGLRLAGELVGGSLAIAVGIGLAAPHLAKTGLGPTAAFGLVLLVGGLVLFVLGLRDLALQRPRWVRYPARAAALLVPLLFAWTIGPAVAATHVPRTELGSRTPADVGLEHREVAFDAADGVRLSGWYVPSTNGAAVVLLHGAGSTRSNVLDQAAVLARAGFGVLLFDARGHGESGGRAMDFGWYGDEDVSGAVDFVRRQPDVDPRRIGAVGLSMGGEEVLGASASVDDLRAIVAEGATGRTAADKAWLDDEYGLAGRLTQALASVTYGVTDLLTAAGPPMSLRDAVRESGLPTLLIAAGDVEDEPLAASAIEASSPETVEVWVVPGADHTGGIQTDPEGWEARVVGFLEEALSAAPPTT
jgi:dienelactone hydrolase